jgi:hypothetical protein
MDSSPHLSTTSDGWSNIKNEPIVNYMAVSASATLFLESVSTRETAHDATFIYEDIVLVMMLVSNTTSCVVGAVTDNTSTNKAAWILLKQRYPDRFFQGCASHGAHLLVKDIFNAAKTKRGREIATYPDDYPFQNLLEFVVDCRELVSFFHNHHAENSRLSQALEEEKLKMLQTPAPTRWGSIQACLYSILKAEKVLHYIVSDRKFVHDISK